LGTAAAFIRLRACAYARDRAVPALPRDRARVSNRRRSDLARAFIDGTESLTGPDRGRTRPPRPAIRPSP